MDSRAKARRKAERKYMRRTVRFSAFLAVLLFIAICVFALRYPAIQARKVQGYIRSGDYQRALSALPQLKDKSAAQRLESEARLAMARDQLSAGQYEDAREALLALGDYGDAAQLAQEAAFLRGEELFAQGDYSGASKMYLLIPDYPGVADRTLELRYLQAGLAVEADKTTAFALYRDLGAYRDAQQIAGQLAMELTGLSDAASAMSAMETMTQEEIANRAAMISAMERLRPGAVQVGAQHTVGLTRGGFVLAAGRNEEGQCDVRQWSGVTQIAAGAYHTAALLSDGTVVATGLNDQGQCDVQGWSGVVEIACGDYATFARFSDGSVAATGYLSYADTAAWRGVTRLRAGSYMAAGLYGSGSVYATHPSAQADSFSDLSDIALTTGGAVGLSQDGRVTATFPGFPGWSDMLQISAGSHCVLGIHASGQVYAHFYRFTDAFEITQIHDAVCVAAGGAHSVILDAEGRLHAFGNNDFGQCDLDGWNLD